MSKLILIVDDNLSVRTLLRDYLTEQGYACVTAGSGRDALFTARHEKPDLILLDIMMPEMDGFDFLRQYRKERDTPVILLTARVEETDKVIGLELGADDYVTKPFGMAELGARIRAVLRRYDKAAVSVPDVLRAGGITLDREQRTVAVSGQRVDLTRSEFDLLAVLMGSRGRTFSRMDLIEALHGEIAQGVERTIDVHIRNLRAKLEPDPAAPRYILTVFGVGYRFAGED
ncbi:MAG: response regulator transcription factor [Chloroflexi bacterium]|jgi:DNA-binding response OmpR family regulator|nr:DNA-binding response regulator [Chloroflexota bacterium]MBV6437776.1 Sensory transduction protein regX3 [Anaerolineae bacterium]MDL1916531.1 response regulator transcription factor [Anaerolineae bacterium CFX4]OQY84565.1 MAG: DNA-binding response regulator [Anaerolineae bacterium UTCFX5]MCC6566904.1 response regulator transcription factor [Chloroflexota bacterium]